MRHGVHPRCWVAGRGGTLAARSTPLARRGALQAAGGAREWSGAAGAQPALAARGCPSGRVAPPTSALGLTTFLTISASSIMVNSPGKEGGEEWVGGWVRAWAQASKQASKRGRAGEQAGGARWPNHPRMQAAPACQKRTPLARPQPTRGRCRQAGRVRTRVADVEGADVVVVIHHARHAWAGG